MKVSILGAGPAGCAAAYFLRQRGIKDITIYEREKVGGCAFTNFFDKIPFEFGPQIMFTGKEYLKHVFSNSCRIIPRQIKISGISTSSLLMAC